MAQRNELLAIANLLLAAQHQPSQTPLTAKTQPQLLTIILDQVRKQNIAQHLPDSLAFPSELRDPINHPYEATRLWHHLDQFNDQLRQDYTCRRQMLLARLDCTIESFKWKCAPSGAQLPTAQTKPLNDQIHETYNKARMALREHPQVTMAHLLAIRETECDQILNQVVGSNSVDCKISLANKSDGQCHSVKLKQFIIPHVPDRGGRTDEIRPPPKESFGYQSSRRAGSRGRGKHVHSRTGHGGRNRNE